jgi:MFS family permease
MGVAYGAYAGAFVVGTSVAGFVIETAGFRAPFVLYLATAALAAVLVLALARPGRAGPQAHVAARTPRIVAVDPGRAREQRVLAYLTGFVYVFGLGTVLSFLPVHAADRGLAPGGVGLVLGSYWLARLAGSLAAGRLSDRIGRRLVLVPALALTGVAGVAVAAPAGIALLAAGTVGLGLAAGACAPTCVGLIADHVDAADRGMAMGLFEAACGASMLLAGAAGGFAAQAWGGEAPYVLVSALGFAWMLVLGRRLRA